MRFDFRRATPVTTGCLALYLLVALLTDPLAPGYAALERCGALIGALVITGEPWRLVTHAFVHGGLIHLALNSMALWQIGPQLERLLGSVRFGCLYGVAAVGGGIAGSLWQTPLAPLVGGSGALFGMLGSMVALNMRHARSPLDFLNYEGPRQLIGLIVANLALGFMIPQVSNVAHIGGLVTGFAFTLCFLEPPRAATRDRLAAVTKWSASLLFLSLLLWCVFPVTRWDYLFSRVAHARSAPERAKFEQAFEAAFGVDFEAVSGELERKEEFANLLKHLRR